MATSSIARTSPEYVASGGNINASTSLAYTGYSVTIPANKKYIVQGSLWYLASAPKIVSINSSSTNVNAQDAAGGYFGSMASVVTMGQTGNTAETKYLWASYNSAGANSGQIKAIYW